MSFPPTPNIKMAHIVSHLKPPHPTPPHLEFSITASKLRWPIPKNEWQLFMHIVFMMYMFKKLPFILGELVMSVPSKQLPLSLRLNSAPVLMYLQQNPL